VSGASRICLDDLLWGILEISLFGEVSRHSVLYEFRSCSFCHDSSRRKLFANVQSLTYVLEQAFVQLLSKIIREDRNNDFKADRFAVFESSCFVTAER